MCKDRVLCVVFLLVTTPLLMAATLPNTVPGVYRQPLQDALSKASSNATQLLNAITHAPTDQIEGVCFLIANMPERDLTTLSEAYILENVAWAYKAKANLPWGHALSKDLFLNTVLPYASVNERRDNWRADFYERFYDVVKDCNTPGEAAVALNTKMWDMIHVKYSTQRRKADQSPYESMEQGLASCTGLSVLLIDACRALCVPARFVGIPQWPHKRGNHSWVEVWDNGWHFTGAFEPDQLDRAWFTGDTAKADPTHPSNCIYATSFKKTDISFPCVWNRSIRYISAMDVTERYLPKTTSATHKKTVAILLRDTPQGKRIPVKVTVSKDDQPVGSGTTRIETNDTNDYLEFKLSPDTDYDVELTYQNTTKQTHIKTAQKDLQIFEFDWQSL